MVLAGGCRMFDPKPVGGTELPTNRTSVIGYARYTSSATEVKTKGGRANNTFDQTLRWPFHPHPHTHPHGDHSKEEEARVGHIL